MERIVGTISTGLRAPIIKQGDNIRDIVLDTVMNYYKQEGVSPQDQDVLAITESVVARAQGNYASVEQIATDVRAKFQSDTIGVIFPILSRNRFAICLKGIAGGTKKIVLMLSYPSDEVGNHLIFPDKLDEAGVNPWTDNLTEDGFRAAFGYEKHPFTGIDYIDYYRDLIEEAGAECEIIFSNHCKAILPYADHVLNCDIHTRKQTKRRLLAAGAKKVLSLDEILSHPVDGSGYNDEFGLLGSNKATESTVKLFPRDCTQLVYDIQAQLKEKTGKQIEVMVYGDGAFKDPVGHIWELADPVVSPGYTEGLSGIPNELKLKYLADNNFADLSGIPLKEAISDYIRHKEQDLTGSMESQGTTPRKLTDLLGSLCDLTSGSGDKGTPIIYIRGYFDNYTK